MDCPRTGCEVEISAERFACARHWRLLSGRVKRRVWDRWDGRTTESYEDVVAAANEAWDAAGVA